MITYRAAIGANNIIWGKPSNNNDKYNDDDDNDNNDPGPNDNNNTNAHLRQTLQW